MARKILPLLFIFLCITTLQNFAQTNHSLSFNNFDGWDYSFPDMGEGNPFIEINYGFGNSKHKKFDGDFAKTGLIELKLGYIDKDDTWEDHILKTASSFFFGSNISTDLSSKDAGVNNVQTKLWRFGVGLREGFGYGSKNFAVIPYSEWGFTWSRLDFDEIDSDGNYVLIGGDVAQLSDSDYEVLKRYDESFRFGKLSEGGIRVEAIDLISLDVAYETAVVFPRHLFWKQSGSFVVEQIGLGLIDEFVDEIFESTPEAAPIVNFLLKNGFAYGFYQLQRDDMNWPFGTETPLTYETFKIGMTFTF